ncbi:MAG: signal peptidase II [Acidobacteriota bacterium]
MKPSSVSLGSKLAIIASVVALDRLTKLYIQTHLSPFEIWPVIPNVFNIVHAENPGAAFSMLAEAPLAVRKTVLVAFSGAVMAVVGLLLFRKQPTGSGETAVTMIGLSLVLGGALGNFWDPRGGRDGDGFPAGSFWGPMNIRPLHRGLGAIFCGAAALLIDLWRGHKSTPAETHV